MNKLKVLHVSDEMSGGGAESVFRDTIKASQENGDTVDYFISDKQRNVFSYIFSVKNYNLLKKKLESFKPNVVHIHNYYHYLSPSILLALKKYKKKNNCKVILTAHDYHFICPNSGLQFYKDDTAKSYSSENNNISYFDKFDARSSVHSIMKLSQYILCYRIMRLRSVVDKILCPSEFLKSTFEKYGVVTDKKLVRNPFDIDERNISETDLIPKIIHSPDVIKIVFFGRLSPEKGIIEFISKLNSSFLNIEFHIYGGGPLEEEIKKVKCRGNLKVIIHDFTLREKLLEEIKSYDMFVLPSLWYENAPNSIIEAGAAGLPVIVSNRGGMIEMAKQTSYYHLLDEDESNIDGVILSVFNNRRMNRIINPDMFTFSTYKQMISDIYRE
ncbi:glycosyltransferase family 4 protein [Pantoea coffeiphila]|uniref:Uncharacterized protein n=1 Tax=Pantoea coffeiphila TaxID=1465635 RepID=A0A2S9IG90_9GAMM|nr:glycosyltransferase family 4 protein [Pantoea coffeiphila]PRD16789.1 hypothetical protein CQW29_03750 [Pantoea coffeiphila]